MHKTFGDRGKEETSRLCKTRKANEKIKILENITLVKAPGHDDDRNMMKRKSDIRLSKRNELEGDEDITDTQSFLNYCNNYIIKSHSNSFSSLPVSDGDNKNNVVMEFPDGQKNKASRLRHKKNFKSRSSSSDLSSSITDNYSEKQDYQIDQVKKGEKLIARNKSSKRIISRNSLDSLSLDSDNKESNKKSRFPEHDQEKKRRKVVEKYRNSKSHRKSSSSPPIVDVMSRQSEDGRNKDVYTAQARRKRRMHYEKIRNYKRDSSTDSSVSNDKVIMASRFLRANRNDSNEEDENNEMLSSPESGRNKIHMNKVINKSFRQKLDFNSDNNSSTVWPSHFSKRHHSFNKTSSCDDADVEAVPTNKKTKSPLIDTQRNWLANDSFSSERNSHEDLQNGENVIHVINMGEFSGKFSGESSVFSCSSDEEEFSNIHANFHAMEERVRHWKVTEFLRKWCPCNEAVDVMDHIEYAKSKSICVGTTLENLMLNSSHSYGKVPHELNVDPSLYQRRKNKRTAKYLPNKAAIKGGSVNSRVKENNKRKRNTGEFINDGMRALELENKENLTRILQGRNTGPRQFDEYDQERKQREVVEKYRNSKSHRESSSSSPVFNVMTSQSEGGRNKDGYTAQARRKRRMYYEKIRSYIRDSSTDSSVSDDKVIKASRFLRANKNDNIEEDKNNEMLRSSENGRNKILLDKLINKSFRQKLDFDSGINSTSKRLHSFNKTSSFDDADVEAVSTNKKTKPPLNDTQRNWLANASFSTESNSHEDLQNEENVIHVMNKRKITSKFSGESSVFSCSSDEEEFSNIGANFHAMEERARNWRVTEFLRKWCPSNEAVDVMDHIEYAKSKSICVGTTLENLVLNTAQNYEKEPHELKVDLSLYQQRKNKRTAKSLPNKAAIKGGSDNSRVKENNKRKRNTSEFINSGVRVLELENKKNWPRILRGRNTRLHQLNTHSVDINKSQKSQKRNHPEIPDVNGGCNEALQEREEQLRQRDKTGTQISKATGDSEVLQKRTKKLCLGNKNLDQLQKLQRKNNIAETFKLKANGEGEEEFQGIKTRLRPHNKSVSQNLQPKNNGLEISKANGEGGAEQLLRRKKELRPGNKHLNESCCENNNSGTSKRKANGEGEEKFQGIKTRLRPHNKSLSQNLQPKNNCLEISKASGEGEEEELQRRKKGLRPGNKHLDEGCCENNNSRTPKRKANGEGEEEFQGIKTRLRPHNKSLSQNLQPKNNGLEISKASGEDEAEELQRRKKEVRLGNKHLDEGCSENNNSGTSKRQANGEGEEEFQGIKTRLRPHNKSVSQNLQPKNNGLEISKANGEGEAEELQRRKKEVRPGNKHLNEGCCENNNSRTPKRKANGEGEEEFQGIKTRLRPHNKSLSQNLQPKNNGLEVSKANGEGEAEELQRRKKEVRLGNKNLDECCCENNNSGTPKRKANGEGEEEFQGIKTRLRPHNKSVSQNLQPKNNGLEISKANGEGEAEELQRRKKEVRPGNKHLNEGCCENNNSRTPKRKANGEGEEEFQGIKTRLRPHNKSLSQNLQPKNNGLEVSKANGEGEAEELQRRKKEVRLGNKNLDECCCENNNSGTPKRKANGEGEEEFQGIKTRFTKNKTSNDACESQEPLQKDKDSYISKPKEEEMQGSKKRLRQRNKNSNVICKPQKSQEEGNDLEASKEEDNRQRNKKSEEMQGSKKRLRKGNKNSNIICKSQKSQEESNELKASKEDDRPKLRKLFSLETWISSPEFLTLRQN